MMLTTSIEHLKINPWIPVGSMFWYTHDDSFLPPCITHQSHMNVDSMWSRNSRSDMPRQQFYPTRCGYRNNEWLVTFAYCKVQR